MNPYYRLVAERAGHRCEYCHAPEVIFNLQFEVEHIVPTSKGGSSILDNLALACRSCNLFKSDHLESPDPATGTLATLFVPRRDAWEDHFAASRLGEIVGLSPTGRATLVLLRMNEARQVAARQQWTVLGLFP